MAKKRMDGDGARRNPRTENPVKAENGVAEGVFCLSLRSGRGDIVVAHGRPVIGKKELALRLQFGWYRELYASS